MKTTDMFARNNRDALKKVLRKFTVKCKDASEYSPTCWVFTELTYKHNDWYSVHIDENKAFGNLFITVYKCHPEWGVSIIAENDCHYDDWGERTEILARELTECIGIIEMD